MQPARTWRPLVVLVASAAIVAAVVSPPGRSFVDSLREAIGVESARPALFSLPAPGRLLVTGETGAWVVQQDGSRRLLGRSCRGLLVAVRELRGRSPAAGARSTRAGRRRSLEALAARHLARALGRHADGHPDRVPQRRDAARRRRERAPRPGAGARRRRRRSRLAPGRRPTCSRGCRGGGSSSPTRTRDVVVTRFRAPEGTARLEWSRDGQRLLVQARRSLRIHAADGRVLHDLLDRDAAPITQAAFGPGGRSVRIRRKPRAGGATSG